MSQLPFNQVNVDLKISEFKALDPAVKTLVQNSLRSDFVAFLRSVFVMDIATDMGLSSMTTQEALIYGELSALGLSDGYEFQVVVPTPPPSYQQAKCKKEAGVESNTEYPPPSYQPVYNFKVYIKWTWGGN
jgi:hypothetical protein